MRPLPLCSGTTKQPTRSVRMHGSAGDRKGHKHWRSDGDSSTNVDLSIRQSTAASSMETNNQASITPFSLASIEATDEVFLIFHPRDNMCTQSPVTSRPLVQYSTPWKIPPALTVSPPPSLLADRIDLLTWEALGQETTTVTSLKWKLSLTFLFAYEIILLAFVLVMAFSAVSEETKSSYVVAFAVFTVFECVAYFVLRGKMIKAVHQKLQHVQHKYSTDFRASGVDLIYQREGSCAYWIFRPLW